VILPSRARTAMKLPRFITRHLLWLTAVTTLTICLVPFYRARLPATKRPLVIKPDRPEREPRTWQERRVRDVEEWLKKQPPLDPSLNSSQVR
jgi:hypothetical protein